MPTFDWPLIRAGYERGLTPNELADTIPNSPTRQAIAKRAAKEGWQVARLPDNTPATVLEGDAATKAVILQNVRNGVGLGIAAQAAGVHENTLYNWRQSDVAFGEAILAARAAFIQTNIKRVNDAGERDWKAASYLLERSPETKDQFSQKSEGGGTTIVLKIDRTEGVTIDGKRE